MNLFLHKQAVSQQLNGLSEHLLHEVATIPDQLQSAAIGIPIFQDLQVQANGQNLFLIFSLHPVQLREKYFAFKKACVIKRRRLSWMNLFL